MQIRLLLIALLLLAASVVPGVAHAQGGCINSPENPTVVLAGLGSVGAALVTLRRKLRR